MSTNPNKMPDVLAVGRVLEVDGENLVLDLDAKVDNLQREYQGEQYILSQFGTIVKVVHGMQTIYARVGRLRLKSEYEKERGIDSKSDADALIADASAFGEGEWYHPKKDAKAWDLRFQRGVRNYPMPSQRVYLTARKEIEALFSQTGQALVAIGEYMGSAGVPCYADLNQMLNQHTAILGSTGTGKSCTVSVVLHGLLDQGKIAAYKNWSPIVVVLDPHNEYSQAFSEIHHKYSTSEGSLVLPHWIMNLDETLALIFGNKKKVSTLEVNIVKRSLWEVREKGAEQLNIGSNEITVDSPIPYTLDDLKLSLDRWRSAAKDSDSERGPYDSIMSHIDVIQRDSRLDFLTKDADTKQDPVSSVLAQFVGDGPPIRIVDLSGVPDEIAGLTGGVIARILFNYKLWQTMEQREKQPILLVCEEAHRYVPSRGDAQYAVAQAEIRRIAKEGRKYGLGLILVSQRPSELEGTVLSQCNSWIILRITNETDFQHVKAVLPDAMHEMANKICELRRQEALFIGQASLIPSRIRIASLKPGQLPRSTDVDFNKGWQGGYASGETISEVVSRWRTQKNADIS